MSLPFSFGAIASNVAFVNREKDIEKLHDNFKNLINTIIISPRRWGKTSLVKKAGETFVYSKRLPNKNYRIAHLDMFNIKSEKEFYEELMQKVLKNTLSKSDKVIDALKKFLKTLSPSLQMNISEEIKFKIGLNITENRLAVDEILDLAENIAIAKNIKIIIAIDEFQNIEYLENPLGFQKKLRSAWQKHQHVVYCLYGSRKHMLSDIFRKRSMPFYRFGDVFFLQKFEKEPWIPFIINGFKRSGKKINKEFANIIVDTMDLHPYFIQQLSYFVWVRTQKEVNNEIFNEALDAMLSQNAFLYKRDIEELTAIQVNLLKAIADKKEQLSSKSTILNYNLGTSASVNKTKKRLLDIELLDIEDKKVSFSDPAFELWFIKYYMKKKIINLYK